MSDGGAVYVDTSVLVSVLAPGDINHRSALDWITGEQATLVTSTLAEVELGRALARRKAPTSVGSAARLMLAGMERVEINEEIRTFAIGIQPGSVRSLDAIHVATAAVARIERFATLDVRQAVAAEEAGMTVPMIGASGK
ncbi:MAG: type II toxin-antitoxin system VapC family toxin [Actinomycetota bacterium]